jgi:hypothetical protein
MVEVWKSRQELTGTEHPQDAVPPLLRTFEARFSDEKHDGQEPIVVRGDPGYVEVDAKAQRYITDRGAAVLNRASALLRWDA